MRIKAVASVADRRRIAKETVRDKFIRQLRPDIWYANDFDRLLEDWLINDSVELKNIILKHKSDSQDLEMINNAFYKASDSHTLLAQEFGYDPNAESFKEGNLQLRIHLRKERNRSLVKRAKERWNQEQRGHICCSICGFSFSKTYGEVGEGFIEAHHVKPITSLDPNEIVKLTDLVPVCSNCHSMLHHNRPWLTAEQLSDIVNRNR